MIRRSRSSGSPRRRKLIWARSSSGSSNVGMAANSNQAFDLLSDVQTAIGGDVLASTVMAIRGRWGVSSDLAVAAPTSLVTAGVVIYNASVASPSLLPATQDRYIDWMAREYWHVDPTTITPVRGATQMYPNLQVRSRRKIEEVGESVFLCLQNQGGAAISFWYVLDVLLALP